MTMMTVCNRTTLYTAHITCVRRYRVTIHADAETQSLLTVYDKASLDAHAVAVSRGGIRILFLGCMNFSANRGASFEFHRQTSHSKS